MGRLTARRGATAHAPDDAKSDQTLISIAIAPMTSGDAKRA
jgi:hypothetical protein